MIVPDYKIRTGNFEWVERDPDPDPKYESHSSSELSKNAITMAIFLTVISIVGLFTICWFMPKYVPRTTNITIEKIGDIYFRIQGDPTNKNPDIVYNSSNIINVRPSDKYSDGIRITLISNFLIIRGVTVEDFVNFINDPHELTLVGNEYEY